MMRAHAMASSVRATLSPAEAEDIIGLVERAVRAGWHISDRVADVVGPLENAAREVRLRQANKRAERALARQMEADRRSRERYMMIGQHFSIMAVRADYADISSDPDSRLWVDLLLQEVMNKPIPDQCEIRRNVWLVRVVRLNDNAMSDIVGSDCTEDDNPSQIEAVAQQLIDRWEDRREAA